MPEPSKAKGALVLPRKPQPNGLASARLRSSPGTKLSVLYLFFCYGAACGTSIICTGNTYCIVDSEGNGNDSHSTSIPLDRGAFIRGSGRIELTLAFPLGELVSRDGATLRSFLSFTYLGDGGVGVRNNAERREWGSDWWLPSGRFLRFSPLVSLHCGLLSYLF